MIPAAWPDPHQLRAVTVEIDHGPEFHPLDLVTPTGVVFAGPELVLIGFGTAAALTLTQGLSDPVDLAAVSSWLAEIPHEDRVERSGSKVLALGALAFDRSAHGRLVVPEVLVGQDDSGNRWATVVGPVGSASWNPSRTAEQVMRKAIHMNRAPAPDGGAPEPGVLSISSFPDGIGYRRAVGRALEQIEAGHIVKVVLARTVIARVDRTPSLHRVLSRLRQHEPACTVFSFATGSGTFLGASPELLVRRRGRNVTAVPLAGTMAALGRIPPDDSPWEHPLETSRKDHAEHEIVVDAVLTALRPLCGELDLPDGTVLVQLGSLTHLGTRVHGSLAPDHGRVPSVLDLVAALHPTPAVGGAPRAEALGLIAELEPVSRGLWAGPVGWVDARGDGEWVVGIRSATIEGNVVTMTAGAGIVGDSDPDAELAETTMKFGPVLDACCPGASTFDTLRGL